MASSACGSVVQYVSNSHGNKCCSTRRARRRALGISGCCSACRLLWPCAGAPSERLDGVAVVFTRRSARQIHINKAQCCATHPCARCGTPHLWEGGHHPQDAPTRRYRRDHAVA